MSGFQLGVVGSLALSVASSVAIVICNKALMSSLGFPFATTLTSWHLMVTFCTLHVAQHLHLFEPKPLDGQTVVLFGLLNGTSIGLLNLSLGFNSVGFYQMTKLAIIPFTVLLETLFLKKTFSQNIKYSLLVLLFGVGIASVTDLKLNLLGSVLSLLAIATTCVGQIIKIKANKHNTEEVEGLFDAAPVSIRTVPSGYFVRDWPIRGPAPHQAQRIRVQLLACSFGIHRPILFDRGVGELQHIPSDRNDVASDVPGARPPQDLPSPFLWLHPLARTLHRAEHHRHPRRHSRHGLILLLLGSREK
ncbi:uncharacterized membrane protein At1g06890-like isoform X2 [Ananas comosus]|uniref:Uncharacterized membrane protein At1g06890-like isoform X2 n=1 Tax=Ananas comosus TaxID=4615 RepID=A0A6P5EBH2_ANACO|nr:uncharacterized membrane protein At1g06890-like isoform X2 [Ananas comosus]